MRVGCVLYGRRAQHDARGPELEARFEALTRSNAAADFEARPEHRRDRSDHVPLHGLSSASALEIDDVKKRDLALPCARTRRRVCVVHGHRVVAALMKAHRLAAQKIDRRDDDHEARNLSSKASPASWLFSG
jgi:hypothetical protein